MPTSNPIPEKNDRPPEGLTFDVPEIIADHTLLRCVGKGSYGEVYLARNQLTGVYRAVKIVFREAFRDARPYNREFEAICRFEPVSRSHKGFVQILQVGKLDRAFYYIMELADDLQSGTQVDPESYTPRTLGQNRGQVLPIEQCIQIGSRLADCLSVLHSKGLIHRDIKPSNIIFVNGQPKLADIGLVAQIEEAKSFVGTAGFMPPEGPVSPASDIFSLGKVLYEISTGKDRCEFPELPADISTDNALHLELNQIVLRACHPVPEKRYATTDEMRRELDLLHTGTSIKRLRQVEKRLRVIKTAFAAFAVLCAVGFGTYFRIKANREARELERQRMAGYLLAEGTSEMRKGYLARALPFFVQAAEYDPTDQRSHRLRVGSVRALAPQPAIKWKSAPEANFSEDGRLLIAPDGTNLFVFESTSGELVRSNAFDAPVDFARFSPDLKHLGVALEKKFVLLDNSGQKQTERTFDTAIEDVAFSSSDGRIAVMLTNGLAYFFDPASGALDPFPGQALVRRVTFDSSGRRMLTSDLKSISHIRDGATGEILSRPLITDMPYGGAFNHDGSIVVVCGWTSAIPFIVATGELAGDTMDNDDAVVHAAFSPDTNIVATANYDGTVRFWGARSFDPLLVNHILQHDSRPERMAFVDEKTLVVHCHDGFNYVWNLGTNPPDPEPIARLPRPDLLNIKARNAQLSAEGQIISGQILGRQIRVEFPDTVHALALSPLNDAFVAGSKDTKFQITFANLYRLSNLDNPIPLNHKDGINYITFSHRGDKVVTTSEDFSAIIWDARTGRRLAEPMRHRWQVMWAAFSDDDRWVVTAGWDGACIVWNAANGDPLTTPLNFTQSLDFVDFEPGETGIVVGGLHSDFRMDLPFADWPFQIDPEQRRFPLEITSVIPSP